MILVTGASGFVGLYLVRALSAQGIQVRALYHNNPPQTPDATLPGVEWQKADLLDVYDVEAAMQKITHVYHCAAIVSFQPGDQSKMLHFNPESTANIVNAALAQEIEKMVYLSSVAAIGRSASDTGKQVTEEEEWGESAYNSAYGISKYVAEMEVWRAIGEGLDAVIINPGIILGSGHWDSGSPALMKVVWNQFPFYTNGVTGWADVEDVVRIMLLCMASSITGERYIVSAGNHSFKEIFTLMASTLGKKPPTIYANSMVTGLAWRLGRLQNLLGRQAVITRETARNAHSLSFYNNEKLKSAFPHFSYTSIEETITKMARSFVTVHKK